MKVHVVSDSTPAGSQVVAVFRVAPSPEELAAVGPFQQEGFPPGETQGHPHALRYAEEFEVIDNAAAPEG